MPISVDNVGMGVVSRVVVLFFAAAVVAGCIGASKEDQALDAAVERVTALELPDGYEQQSIDTREIDSRTLVNQRGSVELGWAPIDGGPISVAAIDDSLVGQGFRRYSNKVCLNVGQYSLDYVRTDIQIHVSMRDAGEVASVAHSFNSSLEAPLDGVIPENEILEFPDCSIEN